ncbi:MAG: AsmA-like C-terminal domain-containing protein, partial [Gammaproteobacteria bacterium]|nr:AsmA-like C-terminal domain-containing protein [Gammaproteobacteria bacterium]
FFNIFNIFDRLTLDFDDVSGEGFVFDSVEGDYEFRDGFALTENVEVKASSADMKLKGRIGMVDKDYDMLMQVEPNTSAAVFTTGTLAGGPILGAGLVLINKLFGLEKSVYNEYKITGSWDAPQVKKVGESDAEETSAQ